MAKVRWASSRFKGEGSSEKCLTTAKTERKGRVRQKNIRVCHGVEFLCCYTRSREPAVDLEVGV